MAAAGTSSVGVAWSCCSLFQRQRFSHLCARVNLSCKGMMWSGCEHTLAALLALEMSSYFVLKLPIILLLSQSEIGPRLSSMGGIILRLSFCSARMCYTQ